MYDDAYSDPWNTQDPEPTYQPPPPQQPYKPGDPGYRMDVWTNQYDPGPKWNNGVGPDGNTGWSMITNDWTMPQTVAPPPPPREPGPEPPPTGGGGGGVPPINVPSATLPPDIASIFTRPQEKTPIQSAYQDALLKYMHRGFETPSLDDSILGPQSEVFRATNQRNTERQRRTAVERAGTGQGNSGYLDNLITQGVQKQGFDNAQFNANLLGGELSKRREELQAALQLASATGNQEATRELQSRLAEVSARMQQQGLNLQGQLGGGDLDLRWALGTEGLNQNALQLIMNGTR